MILRPEGRTFTNNAFLTILITRGTLKDTLCIAEKQVNSFLQNLLLSQKHKENYAW